MPDNTEITCCSWNKEEGYVAAGGKGGLVKVIKLEIADSNN